MLGGRSNQASDVSALDFLRADRLFAWIVDVCFEPFETVSRGVGGSKEPRIGLERAGRLLECLQSVLSS